MLAAPPEMLRRAARHARRITAVSVMAMALSAASLGAIPAAQAAPSAQAHRNVGAAVSAAGDGMIAAKSVTCRLNVTLRYPHPISAVGRIRCSRSVPRITILVRIIRFARVVKARTFSRTHVSSLRGGIAIGCVAGRYRARVDAKVRLANGNVLTGHVVTNRVRVIC